MAASTVDGVIEQVVRLQSRICQVLSNPARLRIVYLLGEGAGERSVGDIAAALGISMANASQHLSLLRQHGVVAARREGPGVYYSLASPRIREACHVLQEFLREHLTRQAALAREAGRLTGDGEDEE